MLRAGIAEALRDTIVGHTLRGMDRYYLQFTDGDLRKAMDKFTIWLDNELQNVDQNVDQVAVGQA